MDAHTEYDSVQVPAASEPLSDGECQQIRQFNGYDWPGAKLITHADCAALAWFS